MEEQPNNNNLAATILNDYGHAVARVAARSVLIYSPKDAATNTAEDIDIIAAFIYKAIGQGPLSVEALAGIYNITINSTAAINAILAHSHHSRAVAEAILRYSSEAAAKPIDTTALGHDHAAIDTTVLGHDHAAIDTTVLADA